MYFNPNNKNHQQTSIEKTLQQQFHTQIAALGRNESHPWSVIKADNTKLYAHHFPSDTLWKLNTRQAQKEEHYTSKDDKRARWDNGCLKLHFDHRWDNGFNHLQRLAKKGHELFILPNYIPLNPDGENGIGADFVGFAPTLFAEIDDRAIDQQWDKIKEIASNLDLEVSLVIFSGGKSEHIYFRLKTPLTDLTEWKRLQQKLICLLGSDPAIANPNREMRVAGLDRKSKNSFQSLELARDRAYSAEEIEANLDASGLFPYGMDDERFRLYRKEGQSALLKAPEEVNPTPKRDSNSAAPNISTNETIPLERCLSRDKQEWLNGVSSQRNETLFNLGRTLLQTEDYLKDNSIPYSGTAEDLFYKACFRCSSGGGWDKHEWNQLWRSCHSRKNQSTLIDETAIAQRISYYQWEQSGFPRAEEDADNALFEQLGETPTDPEQWFQSALTNVLEGEKTSAEKFLASEQARTAIAETERQVYERIPQNSQVNYKPGRLKEVEGPVIYDKGQRKQIWSEARAAGYKTILDNSGTAQGKSHDLANLSPENFDFGTEIDENGEEKSIHGQLVAFFNEPDNPPINMQAHGWKRLTTLSEENCLNADKRRALGEKGLGKSGGKQGGDLNQICGDCVFLRECRQSVSPDFGFGFKNLTMSDYSESKLFAHPKGFTKDDNSRAIGIFDEFGSLVPPTVTEEIDLKQLSRFRTRLQQHDKVAEASGETPLEPELKPIFDYIEPYLSGAEPTPQYGVGLAKIKEQIPDWSEAKATEIIRVVEELESEWKQQDLQNIDSNTDPKQIKDSVDKPWMSVVLSILFGQYSGALRIGRKKIQDENGRDTVSDPKLFITQTNDEQIALVRSFRTAVLLDATLTKDDLVFEYGFTPDEVLEVRQAPVDTPKHKIVQLHGAGLNTSQRSEAGQQRKQKIVDAIRQFEGDNIGVIDYRQYADDGDLHHFRSGEGGARGSNRFKDKKAVVSFGTPYIAVNAALDVYQAIAGETIDDSATKSHEGFRQFYERITQKNIIQEDGRLRANMRPEEPLTFYLVNDMDASFLRDLGVEVTRKPVWEEVPELKPKRHQRLERLAHFFTGIYFSGQSILKAKQKDFAETLDCDPNAQAPITSRLVKALGGWIRLKQKINSLFKTLKTAANFSDLTQLIQSELFEQYGEDLADCQEQLISAIEQEGWQKVEDYFHQATIAQKGQMMGILLASLLGGNRNWLEEIEKLLKNNLGIGDEELRVNSPPT